MAGEREYSRKLGLSLRPIVNRRLNFSNYFNWSFDVNAIESTRSLYDLVVVDSAGIEKSFAESLEKEADVEVYTKLPRGFYINTPLGHYNPDWTIVFREGSVNHVYFVAETKGSLSSASLREVEKSKIECARKHFESLSDKTVVYDIVTNFGDLRNIVTR